MRCPSSMADPLGHASVNAAWWASQGVPAREGGWSRQTAIGCVLMRVVNSEIAKIREAERS